MEKLFRFSRCTLAFVLSNSISVNNRCQHEVVSNQDFKSNIIIMKDSLLRFGVVADKKCTFCSSNDETIIHVFCFCNYSNEVCSKFEFWIFRNTGERIKINTGERIKINCLEFAVALIMHSTVF